MDIDLIRQTIADISSDMDVYTTRGMVKDAISDLNGLLKNINEMHENDEIEDTEYQEIQAEINDAKYFIKQSFDLRTTDLYNTDNEDSDYYHSDDDFEDDEEEDEYGGDDDEEEDEYGDDDDDEDEDDEEDEEDEDD